MGKDARSTPRVEGRPGPPRRLDRIAAALVAALALAASSLAAYAVASELAGTTFGPPAKQVAAAPAFEPASGPERFVQRAGGELRVGGKRWSPIGFNDYRLTSMPGGYVCDGGVGPITGEELERRLARVAAAGGNVVRTWFFQSYWDPDGDGSGDWSAFDRLVEAAGDHGLRVVAALGNGWADCELDGARKELDFYAGGFREPLPSYALSYIDYVQRVARRYRDSATIAWWQLLNEPEASSGDGCDEVAAARALASFTAEAAGAIRAVDPNHLVGNGLIGTGQCGAAGQAYSDVHAELDLCEVHLYDGPETGTHPTDPVPGDRLNGVARRLLQCSTGPDPKPLVVGEIGFRPDLDSAGEPTGEVTDSTLVNRARLLVRRIEALRGLGLDGFLVWQLEAETPSADADDPFGIGPCDPVEGAVLAIARGRSTGHGTLPAPCEPS